MRNNKKSKGLVKTIKIKNRMSKNRMSKNRKSKSKKSKNRKSKKKMRKSKIRKYKGGGPMSKEDFQNILKLKRKEHQKKCDEKVDEMYALFHHGRYSEDDTINFFNLAKKAKNSPRDANKKILWDSVIQMYKDETLKIYIDYPDEFAGLTALTYAVIDNNIPVAKYLIQNGADINHETAREETPLTYAVQAKGQDNYLMIKFLLDNGARQNHSLEMTTGFTPLMLLIMRHKSNNKLSKKKIELLLSYNPDVTMRDRANKNAMQHAIQLPNLYIVDLLLKYLKKIKFDDYINDINEDGDTVLTYAMSRYIIYKERDRKTELIKIINRLLDFEGIKVDIEMPDGTEYKGQTILYTAEQLGLNEIAERLRALGAE